MTTLPRSAPRTPLSGKGPPSALRLHRRLTRALLGMLLVLLVATLAGVGYLWNYLVTPKPPPTLPYAFNVEAGGNARQISQQLADQGLISHPELFRWSARLSGLAGHLQVGSYEITRPESPLRLLLMITQGEVANAAFRVVEGWSWKQVREALAANPDLLHDSAAFDDATLLRVIGAQELHPEGLFFPDTYFFSKQSSEIHLLRRAYVAMQKRLSLAWEQRDLDATTKLGNPYELLIFASIIEKETGLPQERVLVSSVFHNRLHLGMLLQTDPTVIYGMGDTYQGRITTAALRKDTPYNTYTRYGLPPTPIAMPSYAALQAAAHPARSNMLYFVARQDGTRGSHFSPSLSEHTEAVDRYILKKKR